MLNNINEISIDLTEAENTPTPPPGTAIKLENCSCPFTTGNVPFDAATDCRIIDIPVVISHLCPNKEFILFVTVTDAAGARIGQTCSIFVGNNASCNNPFTHNVRLLIKKPICSTDTIYVVATGNYTSICNI